MGDRLPPLKPADLDAAQRELYDSLVVNEVNWAEQSGARAIAPDGSLLGPFNPLLFNPVLGAAYIGVFRADKQGTSLSPQVHEVVVLTVGAVWNSAYELYAHTAVGKTAGLSDGVIGAIATGQAPEFQSEEEACAHRFAWQLTDGRRVDPETYGHAVQMFGHQGVADMVLLIGLYMTTCAIINAFEIPVPAVLVR